MSAPRFSRRTAGVICAITVFVLFQFYGNAVRGYIDTRSLFYWWGYLAVNPGSETEHAWLILALSAGLFWWNLQRARREDAEHASLAGLPGEDRVDAGALIALLAGLAIHALGFTAQQTRISIVGFLVCLWGVLRLAGGRRWGDAARFPVAFMVFAIPLALMDSVGFWLRVWVVNASSTLAHAAGIGVLKSGTQLTAPDGSYNYDVAAACSGIRSLTAMTALSLLAGYLNFRSWRRRVAILLLCFPLVYIGNVARIVAIILAARLGGPKWGDIAHEIMGYGIFAIVLGGVMLAISVLRRRWPEEEKPEEEKAKGERRKAEGEKREAEAGAAAPAASAGPFLAPTIVIVAVAVGEMFFLNHLANLPARGDVGVMVTAEGRDPVELPAFVGTDWIGRRAEVSPVERQVLPPDTGYSRKNYIALHDARQSVYLSVVLSGRDRSSIHRPEICLVGQGWTITEALRHDFRDPSRPGGSLPVTLLRVRREIQTPRGKAIVPQLVAYWFVGGDTVTATHWQRMMVDAWNRVAHARSDRWAYVLMQTDASDGEPAALARMQTIIDATLPAFQKRVAKHP